jgi:hypothetical protein
VISSIVSRFYAVGFELPAEFVRSGLFACALLLGAPVREPVGGSAAFLRASLGLFAGVSQIHDVGHGAFRWVLRAQLPNHR